MNRSIHRFVSAAAAASIACAAQAATITVEPDNFPGEVVTSKGATFSALRNNGSNDFDIYPVYGVRAGSWAPTGKLVFGRTNIYPGEREYHWDNLGGGNLPGAYECLTGNYCQLTFKVLEANFDTPTQAVTVLTTMRGEQATDPVELWAFDAEGARVLRCRQSPVTSQTLQTGVLSPPKYYEPGELSTTPCGEVIEKKNCATGPNAQPGDCDYVVRVKVVRRQGIKFVWFGGPLYQNSHANVDKMTYTIP